MVDAHSNIVARGWSSEKQYDYGNRVYRFESCPDYKIGHKRIGIELLQLNKMQVVYPPRSIKFVRGCGGRMAGRKKKENMAVLYKRVPLRLKAELQKLVNEYVKKHE